MILRKTALLCGTTLGVCVTLAAAGGAMAQSATGANVSNDEKSTDVGEVVVVGSRIRKDSYNTPAPVQLITREESTLAGFASPTDQLQSNQVTGGGGQINNAFGNFVTQGGPGANTLGLRGLGANRTLILLNGRRLAPSGTRGATNAPDLNVLPNISIDRIEILKDGASSIYGSDAVAGVVNVITRRNYEGLEFEGDYHYADKNAGSSYRGSLFGGMTADRFHIQGSLDYYHRTDLALKDRDWTLCNQDYFDPNSTGTAEYIDPNTGAPKCYPVTTSNGDNGVTVNTIGIGGVAPGVAAATIGPGLPGGNGDCSTAAGQQTFGTSGLYCFNRFRPNASVTQGIVGYEAVGGGSSQQNTNINVRTTFDPRTLNRSLISPVSTYSMFTEGTYDLNGLGKGQIYFEGLLSRRTSSQVSFRQLSLDYAIGSPMIPAALLTNTVSGAIAPIGVQTPDMTNGVGTQVRAFIGFGNDHSSQRLDYFKPTLGLRGELPALWMWNDWRYDLTATYSGSHGKYNQGTFLGNRLSNSNDLVVAPGSVDPALVVNGFTCRVNVNSTSERCIPIPQLTPAVVGGALPQAYRDYIFQERTGDTDYWERSFSANIDGTLFKLPGGPVKGAFGYERRRMRIDDTPSLDSQSGNFFGLTSAAPTRGNDSVWELYGELDIPIISDQPFVKRLDLDVSGRYTDYKSYGSENTYKVTALYKPIDMLTVRGTIGTSYRAPALFEIYQGASTGFGAQTTDPCYQYGSLPASPINATVTANCVSENLPNGGGFVQNSSVTIVTAGNSTGTLLAESSKNYTWGIIVDPPLPTAFGRMQLAVDYLDIKVENEITQLSSTSILNLCYQDPTFRAGSPYCALVTRNNDASRSLRVLNGYINIATQRVRGIDYNLRWVVPVGPGSLRIDTILTQYLEQASKTFQTDPLVDANGSLITPKYTGTFEAAYTWKPWKFRYELDWTSGQHAADTRAYWSNFGIGFNNNVRLGVPDYYLHNLSVQYSPKDATWQATLGVRNLADRDPPKISATGRPQYPRAGNSAIYSGYDFLGRVVYLNVTKKLF